MVPTGQFSIVIILLGSGNFQTRVSDQMPANATDIFRQGDALLIPGLPLAVLVQGTAPTAGLLVTVVHGVILGAILICGNGDLAFRAAVVHRDTMVIAPVAVVGVGCAAVTISVLVASVMVKSSFGKTF